MSIASTDARGRSVAIIGGGLAGIAAAVRLAEAGVVVRLIETRKRLGGRATSLVDPRSGETIDNCQHVLMGCCTNLIDLYERLDALDKIEWHHSLYWKKAARCQGVEASRTALRRVGAEAKPSTHVDVMRAGWMPAPLHLAGAFRRMRLWTRPEKKAIGRAMLRMIRMGTGGRHAWHGKTFLEFLHSTRQPPETIETFWNTIIVSACNLPVDRADAAVALHVFQEGFLANRWNYTMGLAAVPLGELYDPAVSIIESSGGEVALGVSAKAIAFDGRRATGVVCDDRVIEAGAVISAVPFDRLDKLVSHTLRTADHRLHRLNDFSVSPILGVHLWFDQPVMDLPHVALVGGGAQWLFNKGVDDQGRQHVHAVISAADDWMALDEAEIVRRIVADVHAAFPGSIGLQPVDARSIKEKRATFAAVPGIESLRPSAAVGHGVGVENLYLAGDWCDTGWPATMEGAVRRGYAAASAFRGINFMAPDVPAGWLSRLLGLR